MKYKIRIEKEIIVTREGQTYDRYDTIYEQVADEEINLKAIIDAFNKEKEGI